MMIDPFISAIRLAIVIGLSGGFFAGCVIAVCRWLNWAPVNITVNVYKSQE